MTRNSRPPETAEERDERVWRLRAAMLAIDASPPAERPTNWPTLQQTARSAAECIASAEPRLPGRAGSAASDAWYRLCMPALGAADDQVQVAERDLRRRRPGDLVPSLDEIAMARGAWTHDGAFRDRAVWADRIARMSHGPAHRFHDLAAAFLENDLTDVDAEVVEAARDAVEHIWIACDGIKTK